MPQWIRFTSTLFYKKIISSENKVTFFHTSILRGSAEYKIYSTSEYVLFTLPVNKIKLVLYAAHKTYLMFIRYWANATASGFPDIVIVRSVTPLSRSSQFDMRIIAPEICLISAIFVPPLPIMHPINSFGTVISCVCWFEFCWFREVEVRNCEPASAAKAVKTMFIKNIVIIVKSNIKSNYHWKIGFFSSDNLIFYSILIVIK